jgi:predicted DNA-binding transcriptional regulator YafY
LEKLVYIIVQLLLLNLSGNEKKNRIECIPVAKNDHMLAILWMLSSGSKITAKQIAEKLEINIRTVYRYINSLCASGVPIIADSGQNGGYWLMDHFIQTPLVFDLEEQKALLHATVFAK